MEPKLFLLVKQLDNLALSDLNSKYRWFRIRLASQDEIAFPIKARNDGWIGYCACDGSGIYNGAFGPLRRKLNRRKNARMLDPDKKFAEHIIDGREITFLEIRNALRLILDHSLELVLSLQTSPVVAEDFDHLLLASPDYNIDTTPSNDIELFKATNQAYRITQRRQSTNNPMDRSGGSAAS